MMANDLSITLVRIANISDYDLWPGATIDRAILDLFTSIRSSIFLHVYCGRRLVYRGDPSLGTPSLARFPAIPPRIPACKTYIQNHLTVLVFS